MIIRLASGEKKGVNYMYKEGKLGLFEKRLASIFRQSDPKKICLNCIYVDTARWSKGDDPKLRTTCMSPGPAYVMAVVAALREIGLDPEAVSREIQKEEPNFKIVEWANDFGDCLDGAKLLKAVDQLLV